MDDLKIYNEIYSYLISSGQEIFCLNKEAWEENGGGFQTQELIENYDESAHYCCAMDPNGEGYDLKKILNCPYKKNQNLVFHGKKIEGDQISEEELERIESERQRFYEVFNQIKKSSCSSIKPSHPFLYCMNDKAEDKEGGAIQKINGVYFCCAMDLNGEGYDLEKILNCPYKTSKNT